MPLQMPPNAPVTGLFEFARAGAGAHRGGGAT